MNTKGLEKIRNWLYGEGVTPLNCRIRLKLYRTLSVLKISMLVAVHVALKYLTLRCVYMSTTRLMITSQTLGYTVTKLVGGVLMDRLNPLNVFIYSLLLISGLLFLLSISSHWLIWLLLYGMSGLTLGSGWPAVSKLLRMYVAPQELATWWGVISSSANVAGCIGSWLSIGIFSVSTVFLDNFAWRAPLIFIGTCCIISALLLLVYQHFRIGYLPRSDDKIYSKTISTKSSPIEISMNNDQSINPKNLKSELKHREGCTNQSLISKSTTGSYKCTKSNQVEIFDEKIEEEKKNAINDDNHDKCLTTHPVKLSVIHQISKLFQTLSPRQRLLLGSSAIVHMCSTFLRYALADWIGVMLLMNKEAYSKNTANLVVSSYECGGIVGCLFVGVVADINLFNKRNLWASRRMPFIIIQMSITCIALLCLSWIAEHNVPLAVPLLVSSVLGITVLGSISLCGVLAVELAPPGLSGTAHALSALAANIGAILAGYPFALLAEYINWSGAFFVAGIASGLSVIPFLCF
uniref:MFS domain-containing protein n=2 Tax=Trichobilharzia regenti TaxID=157069 RepID=A0AA85JSB1_TRIRE|nr:unnamed protein product [Trichobilharzia regenti]